MKYAGQDVVVFERTRRTSRHLVIDDQKVEIRTAEQVWGHGSFSVRKRSRPIWVKISRS